MSEVKEKVYEIICNEFSVSESDFDQKTGPGDLERWDSLGQLRLILSIEEKFKIQFAVDDVMSINNIGDLISLIKKYSDKENSNNESEYSLETSTSVINCIRLPRKTYWGINSINALREIEFQRIALITGSSNRSQNMVNDIRRTLVIKLK